MPSSSKQKLGKATAQVAKNLAVVIVGSVITGILATKSRNAIMEIADGCKQVYNIGVNVYYEIKENRE
ncbi:MAG: hypothetical protein K0R00_203 [Herbinix sp.]|jgi:hypothetical protein|nr:hypothetical protein [Herbinix sp.]